MPVRVGQKVQEMPHAREMSVDYCRVSVVRLAGLVSVYLPMKPVDLLYAGALNIMFINLIIERAIRIEGTLVLSGSILRDEVRRKENGRKDL